MNQTQDLNSATGGGSALNDGLDTQTDEPVDYMATLFRVRDELQCGHVKNCPDAAHKLVTRLNDALAKIATLERKLSK